MGEFAVVHYLNQFFGGIGGEEAADLPIQVRHGPVGPGRLLQQDLGVRGRVVASIVGGDNYVAENRDEARAAVREILARVRPDVVVAGPAFDAGRYGLACGEVCLLAWELQIPSVTAMYPENPGFTTRRRELLCIPTGRAATDMARIATRLGGLAQKLARREPLGSAEEEGYLSRGIRRPVVRAKPGAERAVDLLVARLTGRPFVSEIPVVAYDQVPPAPPVADLSTTRLALVTSGGLVPRGNPDHLVSAFAQLFFRYSIADRPSLLVGEWESIHGGYSTRAVNTRNPNFVVPLDVVRELEADGTIGSLLPDYYVTVGNGTAVSDAKRMGATIATELLAAKVGAALFVAT
jgi:glycine reductase